MGSVIDWLWDTQALEQIPDGKLRFVLDVGVEVLAFFLVLFMIILPQKLAAFLNMCLLVDKFQIELKSCWGCLQPAVVWKCQNIIQLCVIDFANQLGFWFHYR